ncbi:hypothetical protein PV326_005874 [Microctonus aethiopoides]|nr:hypothetical protein PV326_005874 [Microctonus aethiopoides]
MDSEDIIITGQLPRDPSHFHVGIVANKAVDPQILLAICKNCDIMDKKIPFEIAEKFEAYNNEHIIPTFSYNVNSSSNNLSDEEKIVELIILISGFILNVLVLLAIITSWETSWTVGSTLISSLMWITLTE